MTQNHDEILIQMSQRNFDETLNMIKRIEKKRENARRTKGSSPACTGKRKRIPDLKLVNIKYGMVRFTISKPDYQELLNIFELIDNLRERQRKYNSKKHKVMIERRARLPIVEIIKS